MKPMGLFIETSSVNMSLFVSICFVKVGITSDNLFEFLFQPKPIILVSFVEFWRFNPESKWDYLLISLLYFWSFNSNSQSVVYIPYAVLPESSGEYNVLMQ